MDRGAAVAQLVQHKREAVLAAYAVQSQRWQVLQAALLALMGLAALGRFGGGITGEQLAGILFLALLGLGISMRQVKRLDRELQQVIRGQTRELERLMLERTG